MSDQEKTNQEDNPNPLTDHDLEKRAARLEESLSRLARSAGLPLLLRAMAGQDPSELASLYEAVLRLERHPLWETLMKQKPDQQSIVESNGQKTRYGAPDGPRKYRRSYNGQEPLDYPGHEALAQHLATARSEREFTLTALAEHFKVSRMTVHRWKRDPDVLRRADYLARANKPAGDLIVKANWELIAWAQVDKAIAGDTQAAKFCERRAWPEDRLADSQGFVSTMTIGEMCRATENQGEIPTWRQRQIEEERIEAEAAASNGNGDSERPKLGT
ncbi:MAG: hypothetical protein WBC04_24650, partial [Candidatus Acidiferrales bacterium]